MEATIRSATAAASGTAAARAPGAPARPVAVREPQRDARLPAPAAHAPAPLKRGLSNWDNQLQGQVARAQQALDYLERVASQLEAIKGELAAKISGNRGAARQLEAHTRQLSGALEARRRLGGDGLDAQLDFNNGQPAVQRFRMRGLDIASLQAGAPQSLAFSVGGAGGPQLSATIDADMSAAQIAQRLDRTLAPVQVRAALDEKGQLVFSTPESAWHGVQDAIAVSGRGRVETEAQAPALAPQEWDLSNPDALRQSLREVVQSLARVRRSQDAASAALSAAMARAAQPESPVEALAVVAKDFSVTAASHDYESLLAITSALVGVSRERVLALLGLR